MATMLEPVSLIALLVVLAAGGIAAFTDRRDFKVPNLLTLPLLAMGLLFHALDHSGNKIGFALSGALLGFCFMILFYVMGGMGAGDVKLMAAVGAWIGPAAVLVLFVIAALFGGIYAAVMTWRHGTLKENVFKASFLFHQWYTILKHMGRDERIEQAVKRDDRRQRLVPFAAMILAGVVLLALLKFAVH